MTADALILDALRIQPMTGSEIGKGFAPDHIKDRAGWGRKWLARNAAAVAALFKPDDGPVISIAWLRGLIANADPYRSYKHILAPRGTPPRPHFPRATRRIRFCNN